MLRGIPFLLAIAVAACNGGSSGSSGGAGSSGSTGGSGSTSGTGAGTTAATTGSTGAVATSSGTSGTTGGSTGSSLMPDAGDGGPDAGDAGPVDRFCKSIGGLCTGSQGDCCTDLSCQNGICTQPAPTCAGYAEPCDTTVPCCEPAGGSALLTCTTLNDAGPSLCQSPMEGAACGTDLDCPAPLTCVSSLCGTAQTGASCNSSTDPDYHTPCQVGDTCVATQAELSAIEQMGPAADPCNAVGLVCLAASGQSGEAFLCLSPAVEPQQDWSPDGVPFDDTACNPNDATCESYYTGADRAAPVCGPFILGVPDRCMEACTTGDDCDSTTLDCISGQCKPNYCYSNSSNASELSTAQTG